jgi:hypothetical protein
MAFYLRKAIKVGPIRFNLSKSGIGLSTGVTGLRSGTRPDGRRYVHAGRYGLYYRKELGGGSTRTRRRPDTPDSVAAIELSPTKRYESASAATFTESNHRNLVELLNSSYRAPRLDYIIGVLAAVLAVISLTAYFPFGLLVATLAVLITMLIAWWESRRRTIRIEYDLAGSCLTGFKQTVEAMNCLANCQRLWAMVDSRDVVSNYEAKRSAGASSIVNRTPAIAGTGSPPWVDTNVTTPMLKARGMSLYFLPDGVLIYDASGVGHIAYNDVHFDFGTARYIETQGVPNDSTIADSTWRYVNKSGEPDRRFSNNSEIPICSYGQVTIRSPVGLELLLHTSKEDSAEQFARTLHQASTLLTPSDTDGEDRLLVFIENDEWESIGDAVAFVMKQSVALLLGAARKVNRGLLNTVGKENTILYRFLQILLCVAVAALAIFLIHFSWITVADVLLEIS